MLSSNKTYQGPAWSSKSGSQDSRKSSDSEVCAYIIRLSPMLGEKTNHTYFRMIKYEHRPQVLLFSNLQHPVNISL